MNATLTQHVEYTEPTAKQTGFLSRLLTDANTLLDQRADLTGADWPEAREAVARMRDTEGRTRKEVSAMIDTAMDNNKQLRTELSGLGQAPVVQDKPKEFVTTGMYRVGERVFKVLPSRQSERHYAKELTGNSFQYVQGAMGLIGPEHRMTLEEAKEYGRLTGHCCWCGKLLTDPKSVNAGIGPVCAKRI